MSGPLATVVVGALVGSLVALVPQAPASAADAPSGVVSVPCSGADHTATAADLDAFRRAVMSVPDDGTIRLAVDCTYSFTAPYTEASGAAGWYGASALPAVYHSVTIEGRGSVVERASTAAQPFRLFYVGADGRLARTSGFASPGAGVLKLTDLTLAGGLAKGGGGSDGGGGGAGMGGAIFNQGEVELDRVTVRDNVAQGGDGHGLSPFRVGGGGGGGIAGSGSGAGGGGAGAGFVGAGAAGGTGGSTVTSVSDNRTQAGSGGGGGGLRSAEKGDAGVAPGAGAAGGTSTRQTGLGGPGGGVSGGAAGGTSGNGSGGGGASASHDGAVSYGGDGGDGGGTGKGGGLGKNGFGGTGPYSSGGGGGGGGAGGGGGGGGDGASAGATFFNDTGGQGGGGGGGGYAGGGGPGGFGGKGGDNFVGGGGPGDGGTGGGAGAGGFGGGGGGGGRGGDPGKGISDGLNAAPPDGRRGAPGVGAPGGYGAGDGSSGLSDLSGGGGGGAGMGGAIFNQNGRVTLDSVTVTANEARGGAGGGIGTAGGGGAGRGLGGAVFNHDGLVRVDSSTVVANRADAGGGIFNLGYLGADGSSCSAGACVDDARTTLVSSILTGAQGLGGAPVADVVADRPATVATGAANLAASVVDTGAGTNHNIVSRTAAQGGAAITGTPLAVNPGLDPILASNVPSTPTPAFTPPATFAISRDSAAYNAGETALTTDARGVARPSLGGDDIGAFEFTLTTPTMTVEATPASVDLGQKARAKVTMSGGAQTSGTIDFELYGPGDTDCTGTPVSSSRFFLAGGESLSDYTAPMTTQGSYRWQASYTGDDDNFPVTSPCGAAVSEVGEATTRLTSAAYPAASGTGDPVYARTRVIGYQPTGSVTFALHGPSDTDCSGTPVFTSTVALSSQGSATSATFPATGVGSYRWTVSYAGDASNQAVSSVCGADGLTVQVGFRPSMTTRATSAYAVLGERLTATSTVTGGDSPTGDVTFTLYAPDDTTCSTPVFTSTRPLSASGVAESAPYVSDELANRPTLGTYRWRAAYAGDAKNIPLTSSCGSSGQTTMIYKALPQITAQATPRTAYSSGTIRAVATLAGLAKRPGTSVKFDLYAASDDSCTTSLATRYGDLDQATTDSSGRYVVTSAALTSAVDGDFFWVARYAGDTYNSAVATPCGEREQEVVVGGRAPVDGPATITATAVPARATTGSPVHATATLGGGALSGIVYFDLVGPFDAGTPCSEYGAPSTETTAIDGDLGPGQAPGAVRGVGTYTSGDVTPTQPGTYYWRAQYASTAVNADSTREVCGPDAKLVVTDAPVAATPVTPTIANLPAATDATVGSGFTAVVVTDSDGARTVTSSTPDVCTTDGLRVSLVAPGTCSLTPRAAATGAYLAGLGDPQDLTVARAVPTAPAVSNLPADGVVGSGFTATVASSSDGVTGVTSGSPTVCTVDGLKVSYVGAGSCELTARVAQSASYAGREGVVQSFAVTRRTASAPSVSNLPGSGVVGGGFTATVSTDGAGARSVTSGSPGVCTVDGLKVSYVAAGTCSLTAHVASTDVQAGADGTAQAIPVAKRVQIISFAQPGNRAFGAAPSAPTVGSSSGLPVSLTSLSPRTCSVSGATVTVVGGGTCAVRAAQGGNATFAAATPVTRSFRVTFSSPCVTSATKVRDLIVRSGQSACVDGGTVTGGITVQAGGALWVDRGTVRGQVTSTGASAVSICSSAIQSVVVRASTGLVKVGGPDCTNLLGSVVLTRNTRGVAYTDNLARTVLVTGNRGGFTYARNRSFGPSVVSDNS